MERTEKVTLTNMCMIYDDNGNVLVQDKKSKEWPGITFPGGHVEKGESFNDSVIREIYEETGLKIHHPILCGVKSWFDDDYSRYMVLFYKTNEYEGEIVSSDEGDVFWTSLNDMKNMKLADGMESMLKIFTDDELSEVFLVKRNGHWEADIH